MTNKEAILAEIVQMLIEAHEQIVEQNHNFQQQNKHTTGAKLATQVFNHCATISSKALEIADYSLEGYKDEREKKDH